MLGGRDDFARAEAEAYKAVTLAMMLVEVAKAGLEAARAAHSKTIAALTAFDTKASLSDPHKEGE